MLDQIERAAALLRDAARGDEPMGAFMAAVGELVGADMGLMASASSRVDGMAPFATFRYPDEALRTYAQFAGNDAYVKAVAAQKVRRIVTLGSDMWDRRAYQRSEIYNEFYRRFDVEYGCNLSTRARLPNGVPHVQLIFARGNRRGPFADEQARILTALSPHFEAAMQSFSELRSLAQGSLAEAFDVSPDAVAILDGTGVVHYANTRFDELRTAFCGSGLRLWKAPLAAPGFAPVKAVFETALAEVRTVGVVAQRFECCLPVEVGWSFAGLVSSAPSGAGLPKRSVDHRFLLVLRKCGSIWDERVGAVLRRYRLTAAEARVLRALIEGTAVKVIADRFGLSPYTVRTHVKNLLAKTGCRRQQQLARMVELTPTGRLRLLF